MTRPKLRVIQGGAATPPPEPTTRPRRRTPAPPPEPSPLDRLKVPQLRFPGPKAPREPRERRGPTPMTWLFAVAAMGGVAVAWAGQPLIGLAMSLAGAAAMVAPPNTRSSPRARRTAFALVTAATLLALADIAISLLG